MRSGSGPGWRCCGARGGMPLCALGHRCGRQSGLWFSWPEESGPTSRGGRHDASDFKDRNRNATRFCVCRGLGLDRTDPLSVSAWCSPAEPSRQELALPLCFGSTVHACPTPGRGPGGPQGGLQHPDWRVVAVGEMRDRRAKTSDRMHAKPHLSCPVAMNWLDQAGFWFDVGEIGDRRGASGVGSLAAKIRLERTGRSFFLGAAPWRTDTLSTLDFASIEWIESPGSTT